MQLMQPICLGGHPHNWNAISRECLCLLRDLTERLVAHQDAVASNGRVRSQSASSNTRSASSSSSGKITSNIILHCPHWQTRGWFDRFLSTFSSVVLSGMEDVPETPRPTVPLRTPGSVFKSSVGGVHSSLTAPFTPDVDSPFCSPAIRRLVGQQDPQSPWFGTVQSPHVMRRGPKLWSASTGKLNVFTT